jgi:multiple sugar transport system permease protein
MLTVKKIQKTVLWYVVCLVFSSVVIFPIVWMVFVSFKSPSEIFNFPQTFLPQHFNVNAYVNLFKDSRFIRALFNSYIVAFSVVILTLFLSMLAAYGFSRFKVRWNPPLLKIILLTQVFSGMLLVIPYYIFMYRIGLYDTYAALIISDCSFALPFSIWILKNYFDAIPTAIDDSARVDGCSRMGVISKIILPISLPGIIATAVFVFLLTWNEYLFAFILTSSANKRVLTLLIATSKGQFDVDWCRLMAMSSITIVPLIAGFTFLQKYIIRGLTGAITGE